jgi:hypothetical protein
MGLIKGKFIRITCDNDINYHGGIDTGDYAGRTYPEAIKAAKKDGWINKGNKWYCPYCVGHNLIVS